MSPNNPLSIRGLSILEQVWVRFEHPEEGSGGSEGYFIAVLVVSKLLTASATTHKAIAKASEPLQGTRNDLLNDAQTWYTRRPFGRL